MSSLRALELDTLIDWWGEERARWIWQPLPGDRRLAGRVRRGREECLERDHIPA
jgi:hypothetical protein